MPRGMVPVLAPVRRAAVAGSFSPGDVAGLQLWLKADAGTFQDAARTTAASADGDPVGGWADQSGNGRHFSKATAAAKPTLKLAQINGRPVVRFDGVDDLLQPAGVALSDVITASAYTMYLALKVSGADTNGGTTYANDAVIADALGYFGLFVKSAPAFFAYNWDGSEDSVSHGLALGTACGVRQRHAGGSLLIRQSGLAESSVASGDTTILTGALHLGQSGTHPAFLDGDLGELLVYNTDVAAADQAAIEGYLGERWGISW